MSEAKHINLTKDVAVRRWRIVVENTSGAWRYIATIVLYGLPDGGFAVIPAYQGREGYICKYRLKDTYSHFVPPTQSALFDGRRVTRRVKLSFHRDGATQISAADVSTSVLSGPDGQGGFRGIGIIGRLLESPVYSGAVFSLTCWGLEHYPRARTMKRSICFSRTDLGRKGLLGRGTILLMGYLIQRREPVEWIEVESQTRLRSTRWNGITGRRERMELRLVNLRNEHSYLGIDCTRMPKGRFERNPSGFMMSSQRSLDDVGIQVVFPPPSFARSYGTLDRGILPHEVIKPFG